MGEIESRPRLLRLQAVVHLTKGETKEEDEREDQETLAFSISLDFAFTNRVLPPRRPDVAFHHDRSSLFLSPSLPHSLFLSHTHTRHASPFIPKRNTRKKREHRPFDRPHHPHHAVFIYLLCAELLASRVYL